MWTDPRVEFVSADFLEPSKKDLEALKDACRDVTHVYFASYVHNDDLTKLAEKNVPLFKTFMDIMEQVCPKLERVCLQTGGKVRTFDGKVQAMYVDNIAALRRSLRPYQTARDRGHRPLCRWGPEFLLPAGGLHVRGSKTPQSVVVQHHSSFWHHRLYSSRFVADYTHLSQLR